MARAGAQPRLPCGRLVDDVWDRIDAPPTAHEQSCEFCTEARGRLARLAEATAELRLNDDQDPAMQIGVGVKSAIMQIARTEIRRSRILPLQRPAHHEGEPRLAISEQAVTAVIRAAADTVPGLRARRCTVDLDTSRTMETAPNAPPEPAVVIVELRVAVAVHVSILEAVAACRARIEERMSRRTGLIISAINITVEDLYDD